MRCLFHCALALSLICLTACGKPKVTPNGKLMKGGKPFTVSQKGMFVITLYPEGGNPNDGIPVDVEQDGTFKIVGKQRKGITPGKYKVAIQALDPYGQKSGDSPGGNDKLQGKFTADKTTLTVEVPAQGDVVITIPD